jgi:hypothetical protein
VRRGPPTLNDPFCIDPLYSVILDAPKDREAFQDVTWHAVYLMLMEQETARILGFSSRYPTGARIKKNLY